MPKLVSEFARFMPKDQTGLSVRRNPKNGFVVIELDYFANPAKRSKAWIEEERRGMPPKQWAVEMERSWETYAGKPVYENAFYKLQHVSSVAFGPNPDYPIFRGWDFGGNQSVAICQVINATLYVLDEIPNAGTNTRQFAPEVIAYCNANYGTDYHYIDVIDPSAMWEGKTAEGVACADVMREEGLLPIPAPTNDPQKRIDAVIKLLMRLDPRTGKACLQINPHCSMLIRAFEGGYHYPEKPRQAKKADRPVKNLYSHVSDCLQYVALRMNQQSRAKDYTDHEDIEYERSLTNRYQFGKR